MIRGLSLAALVLLGACVWSTSKDTVPAAVPEPLAEAGAAGAGTEAGRAGRAGAGTGRAGAGTEADAGTEAGRAAVEVRAVPELPAEHGLRTLEAWTGGASPGDEVPTVVLVHGLGDSPEGILRGFVDLPVPARFVLPAGPHSWGRGHAWMTVRTRDQDPDALAAQLDASAARVAALCRDLEEGGTKPILTGFSQGGMIAWTVAARHPDTIRGALPLSGYLPERLEPPEDLALAPVVAFHGDADPVVPIALARSGADALARQGKSPEILTFSGDHRIPATVRVAVARKIAEWSE